jgi:ribosomal-protein-alanine N-acetyltransferase
VRPVSRLGASARIRMRIQLKQCALRKWQRSDKESLVSLANNFNVARNLTHEFPHPYGDAEADSWFSLLESQTELVNLAIEVCGRAVGGIGIRIGQGVFSRSAELGYWLGEPYWGRGVMTEAVCAFAPYVMTHFGLLRLYAYANVDNYGSIRVLDKAGFIREGVARASAFKYGKVVDRVFYAKVVESAG